MCCIAESVEKIYQFSFVFNTGSQSHYAQRRAHAKDPEWLYQKAQQQVDFQHERNKQTHQDRDKLRSEAKDLRAFAKEFGRGVRQQRARGN